MNQAFGEQGLDFSGHSSSKAVEILVVSELVRRVAGLLEREFPLLRVRGEISNLSLASSGHLYFSLKDRLSQIRCVMFRTKAQSLGFRPKEGDLVDVLAQLCLYEPRGDMQLQIENMRPAGQGNLQLQYLRLRQKLQAEGLFDQDRKRPLPALPKAIGVITSLQAAALRDVLATLAQRMPSIPVVIYPASVQGLAAPQELIDALRLANTRLDCEVLLLVRGGGSIEDLWAFNDEALARSIAASTIPVVAGIGHESDVCLADFAADARAPTPTAAAAQVCPTWQSLQAQLEGRVQTMQLRWQSYLRRLEQVTDHLSRQLKAPSQHLQARALAWHALSQRLRPPPLERLSQKLEMQAETLRQRMMQSLQNRQMSLEAYERQFALLSPQRVLERGYAIALDESGKVVSDSLQVKDGDRLNLRFAKGAVHAIVSADGESRTG